ncbi:Sodium/potassium-transporting ATPase subunit beta-2 [Blattella germanica]|nr:Sodium/potassium-transporting ATPase subunit beta-2 [Blattella germanica]
MWLFLQTISNEGPKWYLDESLIGSSPGLGYRPMSEGNEESTLIWYNTGVKNNHKNWTKGLDDFLTGYNNYDYPNGKPCVFIKLNKILNWVPDYYDDPKNLPSAMPKDLKKYIKEKGDNDPKEGVLVNVECKAWAGNIMHDRRDRVGMVHFELLVD